MSKKRTGLAIGLVFFIGIGVGNIGASSVNKEIKALLNATLKIKVNGSDFIPAAEDGSRLYPISYNGRTYLPVQSIAKALSVAVSYDAASQTIYIGERDRIPMEGKDYVKNYTSQFSSDKSQLLINGKQYSWGIVYTGTEGYYEYSGFIYPNGKYQRFGGVACMEDLDKSTEEVIIKIRENNYEGRVLKEITIKKGESIPFEIDIAGIKTLYIQNLVTDRVPKNTKPDQMILAEPYFK